LPEGDWPEGDWPEGDWPEGDWPEGDLQTLNTLLKAHITARL